MKISKVLVWTIVMWSSVFLLAGCMTTQTPPVITETTAITTPTNNSTPSYVFSSTESWTIMYSWDCTSTITDAVSGENTITFTKLADWEHANCTLQVRNGSTVSNTLVIPSFAIDTVAPIATVTYDPTTSTSKEVVATLTGTNKPITVQNNWWSLSYTFTGNGNFIFNFVDSVGNTWSATATVTWIKAASSPIVSSNPLTTTGAKK